MRRITSLLAGLAAATALAGADLNRARALYQETRYDEALFALEKAPAADAAVLLLRGQCYYQIENHKKASELLERAATLAPNVAETHLWLARAYGRRAETSSFVTAPGLARKAREHFEKAHQLDQQNLEVISDLFEYYLQAPGFLGGGLDKAEKLAQWIRTLDPVEYHYAQAKLAEKRRDYHSAEKQLRGAMQLAPKQVGRVVELARFLARQGRLQESDDVFRQAARLAPDSPTVIYARAAVLVESKRNLAEARDLLRRYLELPLTPEDPSRLEARRLLKQIGS